MTTLTDSEKYRLQQIVQKISGPTPWYWKMFPEVKTASGRQYEWTYHGEEGSLAYLVTLNEVGHPQKPLLALNTYCTPFALDQGRLGLWCPEGRSRLRLLAIDPDILRPFPFEEIVGWFKQSTERVYCTVEPLSDFDFSAELTPGTHELAVPEIFHAAHEILMVAARKAMTKEEPACSVFVLYPHAGLVEVLPQSWFKASEFDAGMQWITRLTRDPVSHRIIGDGFRIPGFCLSEDGRDLDGWLE